MEIVVVSIVFIGFAVFCLCVGDLIRKRFPHAGDIFPMGIHVFAFLLFLLGVVASYSSWNEEYSWQNLVGIPPFMAGCVYAAGLLVVLRIKERRIKLFKFIFRR